MTARRLRNKRRIVPKTLRMTARASHAAILGLLLAGCSDAGIDEPLTFAHQAPLVATPAAAFQCADKLASNQCQLSGVITVDTELRSDQRWFPEGRLQVGSNANQAVLFIEASTDVLRDSTTITLTF